MKLNGTFVTRHKHSITDTTLRHTQKAQQQQNFMRCENVECFESTVNRASMHADDMNNAMEMR